MSGLPQARQPRNQPSSPPRERRSAPVRLALTVAAVIGVLLILGTIPRWVRTSRINHAAEEQKAALPAVTLVHPHLVTEAGFTLPGNIQGGLQTTIQARTSGYINKILVDIGTHVKRGQVLAEIASPDVDQQLSQAQAQTEQSRSSRGQSIAALAHSRQQLQVQRAAVVQQKAQVAQAQSNFKREWDLWGQGFVARQDAETAWTALKTARANLKSAEAAVAAAEADIASSERGVSAATAGVSAAEANQRRYGVMRSFEKVTAPFDGVITARNVDTGALVNAGGGASGTTVGAGGSTGTNAPSGAPSPTSGQGLFQIANFDSVKVQIQVPETFAPSVQQGADARLTVRELPGQAFQGRVDLSSEAIDPASRTLTVLLVIPNPAHALLPGMFARVTMRPKNPPAVLRVPDSSLVVDAQGTRVAVLAPGNKVHFQPVRVGRDFGTEIEVLRGVREQDSLINTPSDTLQEGAQVNVVEAAGPAIQRSRR